MVATGAYPLARHGRARPGHPRLYKFSKNKDVDARHKAGHDELADIDQPAPIKLDL
jgi:hypothetical protein